VEGKVRFHDLGLPDEIMHAIADLGFEYCTPIQAEVLPLAFSGKNIAGQAQTGTGKTAAFLVSIFARFLSNPLKEPAKPGTPRALIIAPTRELVIQIEKDARELSTYSGFRTLAVYGGTDYVRQEHELTRGTIDVVAATPGRLLDFARRKVLDLGKVETLVIDEADRMLDMGFIPDVRRIMGLLPAKDRRLTMLFSATLSGEVLRLASQWMPDPFKVEVAPEEVAVGTVEQIIYSVASSAKFRLLVNLLQQRADMNRVLIFGNRRDRTKLLSDKLAEHGVPCQLLSGLVDQNKRIRILDDFRGGKFRVLVATDVAGRGIHVDGISHVINYDFPYEAEDYVHRIGRTGRAGLAGTAISFACEHESFIIPDIERFIGKSLKCAQPEESLLRPLPVEEGSLRRHDSHHESRGRRPPSREGSRRRSVTHAHR
jgi:ATP-dependent RNA helicase RhlB